MTQATKDKAIALKTVIDLFQALDARGVRYCHWKSNLRLKLGLRGQTDLDLLVDPEHARDFREVLEEHQVKLVLAPPGKHYPAVENYLGLDPTAGKLFHLHVHYQLVLGEQFVKNYRLPLEDVFLHAVRFDHGVKIPAPELELIVLSLRALLKYRDRDVIKDILSIRSPGIPAHVLDEIHWLLGQISVQDLSKLLVHLPKVIPSDVVVEFLETVVASPRDGYKLYRLRRRVRGVLRRYQRQDRFRASLRYFGEVWRRRKSFLRFRPANKMTLPVKGLTVALVGADGAGKTTLCHELARWLSWKLDVRLHYLGSKKPSWLSKRLHLLFRIARRSQRTCSGWFGEKNVISRVALRIQRVLLYSHCLSIGRDRYRRYRIGRRRVANGSIVIYDRFPLIARLDGPQIPSLTDGNRGIVSSIFSKSEHNLYRKFQYPDLLVVLHVKPATSLRRKPDHRRHVIKAKNLLLRNLTDGTAVTPIETNWVHLNADLPFEDVLKRLKQEVWAAL